MVRQMRATVEAPNTQRRFCSVATAAQVFDVSEMTLYHAIRSGQFPAVRIMGRLVVPLKAIEAIEDAASERHALVDAAEWVEPSLFEQGSQPSSGAKHLGSGPFSPKRLGRNGEAAAR